MWCFGARTSSCYYSRSLRRGVSKPSYKYFQEMNSKYLFFSQFNDTIRIRVGATNKEEGTIHKIDKIIFHPNFTTIQGVPNWDVALIVVQEPFNYSESIQPINLTTSEPKAGELATVSGWGDLSVSGNSFGIIFYTDKKI